MLQIINDDDDEELELSKNPELVSLEMLLDYLIHEVSCKNNFEFVQAVVRLFLKVGFPFIWMLSLDSAGLLYEVPVVEPQLKQMIWFNKALSDITYRKSAHILLPHKQRKRQGLSS